jgi:NTP pyrophosphatase (non-canonical NTP hydrolase)
MKNIDLNKYKDFVQAVTSKESNDLQAFQRRLAHLDQNFEDYGPNGEMQNGPNINVPLLITSGLGLGSEAGEFQEILKKLLFQGKPLTEENVFHMKRELGDVIWYWVNACRALGLDPNDVIVENVNKLESRYPGGEFDPFYSENRQVGDL